MRRGILTAVLLFAAGAFATASYAGTRNKTVYWNCNNPSGIEVIDLACNIYWETGPSEPLAGKYLVALSVRNRVRSPHYPNTYSEVSYEIRYTPRKRIPIAQYSWRLDGKPDKVHSSVRWVEAMGVAADVIAREDTINDITHGCMWYHRADIVAETEGKQRNIWNWRQYITESYRPYWAKQYRPTVRIGNHQCYTLKDETFNETLLSQVQAR